MLTEILEAKVRVLEEKIARLEEEVRLDNEIITERNRILERYPCPVHGNCVPWVLGVMMGLEEEHEKKIASVLRIRCAKHYQVPQYNKNESAGGECGACIVEEKTPRDYGYSESIRTALKDVREYRSTGEPTMSDRAEIEKLVNANERLTSAVNELTIQHQSLIMQCHVNDQAARAKTVLIEEASKEAGKWRSEYERIKGKLYKLYSDE